MLTYRDMIGHLSKHVTLTYKVTHKDHAVGCHSIVFPDL